MQHFIVVSKVYNVIWLLSCLTLASNWAPHSHSLVAPPFHLVRKVFHTDLPRAMHNFSFPFSPQDTCCYKMSYVLVREEHQFVWLTCSRWHFYMAGNICKLPVHVKSKFLSSHSNLYRFLQPLLFALRKGFCHYCLLFHYFCPHQPFETGLCIFYNNVEVLHLFFICVFYFHLLFPGDNRTNFPCTMKKTQLRDWPDTNPYEH